MAIAAGAITQLLSIPVEIEDISAAEGQVLAAPWVVMFVNWILFKIFLYPYCSPTSLELRCKSMRSETEGNLSDKLIFP